MGLNNDDFETNTSENLNVDFFQKSGMILLTVCQSLQIINHAKSHRHSCLAGNFEWV